MESVSTQCAIPPQAQVVLPPALTIETVGDVAAALTALPLDQGGGFIIDGSQTHHITIPALQTLLAFGRAVSLQHGQFFMREAAEQPISHAFAAAGIPIPFTHGA